MRVRVALLSILGAGSAFGQTAATPKDASERHTVAPVERRPLPVGAGHQQQAEVAQAQAANPVDLLRQNGNSLLKAQLASPGDPRQATLKEVSYTAVSPPEPKVIRKHDLVTIIIREQSTFSSDGKSELKRESTLDAAITDFVKLKLSNFEIEGGGIGPIPPRVSMEGKRESKDEGTVDRTDTFTARITAEVLDVKPNGTLVLQARKRIRTDDEEQTFIFSGICRAEDISADNTILSSAIHDQETTKTHKGTVREATRRGWGGKLLDAISPF
jgi:flagellar L-ring protein precursor FlgH